MNAEEAVTQDGIRVEDLPRRFRWAAEAPGPELPPLTGAAWDEVVEGLAAGGRPRGVYLHGATGVGKTVATVALLGRLRRRRLPWVAERALWYQGGPKPQLPGPVPPGGVFLTDREVIRLARSAMEQQGSFSYRKWLDGLQDGRQLVVLDDLASGTEAPYTAWEVGILNELLDLLYAAEQPLVVTSNKGLPELAAILGDRIPSRLVEACTVIAMEGADRRLARAAK